MKEKNGTCQIDYVWDGGGQTRRVSRRRRGNWQLVVYLSACRCRTSPETILYAAAKANRSLLAVCVGPCGCLSRNLRCWIMVLSELVHFLRRRVHPPQPGADHCLLSSESTCCSTAKLPSPQRQHIDALLVSFITYIESRKYYLSLLLLLSFLPTVIFICS